MSFAILLLYHNTLEIDDLYCYLSFISMAIQTICGDLENTLGWDSKKESNSGSYYYFF